MGVVGRLAILKAVELSLWHRGVAVRLAFHIWSTLSVDVVALFSPLREGPGAATQCVASHYVLPPALRAGSPLPLFTGTIRL